MRLEINMKVPQIGITGMDAVTKKAKPKNQLRADAVFTKSGKQAIVGLRAKPVVFSSKGRNKNAIVGIK